MLNFNNKGFLSEDGYELVSDPKHATLFTTGNGYIGVRGSYEEYGSARVQGAYIRGLIDEIIEVMEPFPDNIYMKKYYFDEDKLKDFEMQDSCINFADILLIRFEIENKTFFPWEGEILSWNRYLDIDKAALVRKVDWKDENGNITRFKFERFSSYDNQHVYVMRASAEGINHNKEIKVISGVDKKVRTGGQRIISEDKQEINGNEIVYSLVAGKKYGFKVGIGVKSDFFCENKKIDAGSQIDSNGIIACSAECAGKIAVEKKVYINISRDHDEDVYEAAKIAISSCLYQSYEELQCQHLKVWSQLLAHFDIKIEGDCLADSSLRIANYHTIISGDMNSSIHGLSAKSLSGERYNQFVWWDSEIYQLPIFIHAYPQIAKNSLMFRYKQLNDAKANAKKEGFDGARFPFVASIGGGEKVWKYARHPHLQIHITADIGFALMNYYENTADMQFLESYGYEMLSEILKYWCGRVTHINDRYEILNVTGTDEHHPYVNNDAYTNYIVKLIFDKFIMHYGKNASARKFITEAEFAKFQDVANKIYLPIIDSGLIPQFDNYFNLTRTLQVEGKGTGKSFQMKQAGLYHLSQVIKQPDVMLLFSYINYPFEACCDYSENWDYYEKMCESSSSLSYPVHAICSIDNKRVLSFYNYFLETVRMDIDDIHSCAWQGMHAGCAAGGYYVVFRGVFGIVPTEDKLYFAPKNIHLWKGVSMQFMYHGVCIKCKIQNKKLILNTDKEVEIVLSDKTYKVHGEREFSFD